MKRITGMIKMTGMTGMLVFKPKYWANLFNYTFFVLFFCSLLHRLAVRITSPFHIFLSFSPLNVRVFCLDSGIVQDSCLTYMHFQARINIISISPSPSPSLPAPSPPQDWSARQIKPGPVVRQHMLHVSVTGNIFRSDACSLYKEFCRSCRIYANR